MGWRERAGRFLTNPENVKNSAIIGVAALTIALVVGMLIAQLDPDGYNIFQNYISDLGSFEHTPFPYLWDFGQMICACCMVPAAFYLKQLFATFATAEAPHESSTGRRFLSYLCFGAMIVALVGMFNVGLFSEDRTTPLHLHLAFSYVVFGGLAVTSLFFGIAITRYPSPIPRVLGIYMMVAPPIVCVVFFTTFIKLSEWLLMFSLIAWLIPFALLLLKHLNREIRGQPMGQT